MDINKELVAIKDKNEIQETLILYTVAVDTRNWELLKNIFIKDAKALYGDEKIDLLIKCSSLKEITEMCKNSLNGCGPTQHLFGNFRINLNDMLASSICSAHIGHVGKEPNQSERWDIWAEYQDNWTKTVNGWRIKDRRMRVLQEFGDRKKVLSP
jgi:hypothetical protein